MDTNNWRPTQGGEPAMGSGDWRPQLHPDSRQRIVNKIMETLKRHLPVSGHEGLSELWKIAVRFEEKIYTAATSQSDYLRKISLKMLTMETGPGNNSVGNSFAANSMVPSNGNEPLDSGEASTENQGRQVVSQQQQYLHQQQFQQQQYVYQQHLQQEQYLYQQLLQQQSNGNEPLDSASLDSTAQTGQANGGDWKEEIYRKIKAMEELYFLDLNEMYQKILSKVHQFDSLPQQPKSEQLEKLKIFKAILERLLAFLQVPKQNIVHGFADKIGHYEQQIVCFLNSYRPRNPVLSSLQPGQVPASHMQGSVATVQQNNMNNLQQDFSSLQLNPNMLF